MMSYGDLEQRPAKKRRFFVEDSPEKDNTLSAEASLPDEINALDQSAGNTASGFVREGEFDVSLLESFVGEPLSLETIEKLKDLSGNNVERAINLYLDGSWRTQDQTTAPTASDEQSSIDVTPVQTKDDISEEPGVSTPTPAPVPTRTIEPWIAMPNKRYIGAFGVTAWATRSGSGLISYGDEVKIERTKPQGPGGSRKTGKLARSAQKDVVVRFTNSRGEEIGRLENDYAAWISTLIDQKVCIFQGNCVYAPERLRTSDNIYLQLRCFLLKTGFESGNITKPVENNRKMNLFEAKESVDERNLRLRQVALIKMFDEIKLHPLQSNDKNDKHKREKLLKAAEAAEQNEKDKANQTVKPSADGTSSPPSEENEEGEELEQDQLDTLYKKAQSFDFDTPTAEPANSFVMELRKYQKQALYWMMSKEKDEKSDHKERVMHPLWEEYAWPTKDVDDKELAEVVDQVNFYVNPYSGEMSLDFPLQEQNCLGGILADEMGLGKTIEMLSLIHSHKSDLVISAASAGLSVNNLPRLSKDSKAVEHAPATTLVIAPMSLLAQWQSEAEKASSPGTLNVMVYYGSEKSANLQKLCCEANAATAPNVIITSYGVVLSEFNQVAAQGGNRGSHGGLFSLEYFRIILDEGHFIKNRQSKTAKACYELKAIHRWVLTGTPIVNRLEDLFSLVHFLRVEPWSNFSFWKTFITVPFESKDFIRALDVVQTVLEPLVLRRTKDMKTPDGKALVPLPPRTIEIDHIELSKPERDVYDWIFWRAKRSFAENVEKGTVLKSYTTIFAQILRLRQSCCHPSLIRNKAIAAEEEDAIAAADLVNGFADDMDLQSLIARFEADTDEQDANKFGAHVLKQIQDEADSECPICSEEPMMEQAVTGCWHSACKKCLLDYIEHQKEKGESPRCFNCREPINSRDIFQVVRHHGYNDVEGEEEEEEEVALYDAPKPSSSTSRISLRRIGSDPSAKIAALTTYLKTLRSTNPHAKSVVFSQFTSFLELITPALSRESIPTLRFDGSMSQKARAAVLEEFQSTTNKKNKGCVLLLSLRAGGVGLNLTSAERVFMMDPWWSFAVEAQAIDRVHRMGQEREVRVVRFIAKGSIEEKMLRIQERKKFIASSLGMMSDEEKKMQRIEDIKELLS
ncbi:DNA repair protein, RAD5 [Tothia fuscella]|uniref:DNA repair protein, RAD5 n=1 Tax=Tothia fuscella TaxID=1048955 RepID=A0A9P4TUD1_9PEZI|nr:DNA repair protein, RAD5 [Tothia fuscella]